MLHIYGFVWILFLVWSAYDGKYRTCESESESESEPVTMIISELEPEPLPETPEPVTEPVPESVPAPAPAPESEPAPEPVPVSVKLCTCVRACGCVRAYLEPTPELAHEPVAEPASESEPTPPTAAHYRLSAINHARCVGRSLGAADRRFKPAVFYEAQCGRDRVPNSELCKVCLKRQTLFFEEGNFKNWNGLVTEDPLDCCHMLGTQWANKVKWIG